MLIGDRGTESMGKIEIDLWFGLMVDYYVGEGSLHIKLQSRLQHSLSTSRRVSSLNTPEDFFLKKDQKPSRSSY